MTESCVTVSSIRYSVHVDRQSHRYVLRAYRVFDSEEQTSETLSSFEPMKCTPDGLRSPPKEVLHYTIVAAKVIDHSLCRTSIRLATPPREKLSFISLILTFN